MTKICPRVPEYSGWTIGYYIIERECHIFLFVFIEKEKEKATDAATLVPSVLFFSGFISIVLTSTHNILFPLCA